MDSKQNRFPSQGPPVPSSPPCGACKFLRRKCVPGCVFAPHFTSDQGPARFAAVHKVFGASNVSKLLQHVPVGRRDDAVVTICYEAQARLTDPVYGCVSTIHALQQQVATLQTELSIVRSHLISSKLAAANSLTGTQQIQQQNSTGVLMQQQSFSNASSASDVVDMSSFTSSGLELISSSVPPSQSAFEQLQLSSTVERGDEEEESDYPVDDFADGVLQHK